MKKKKIFIALDIVVIFMIVFCVFMIGLGIYGLLSFEEHKYRFFALIVVIVCMICPFVIISKLFFYESYFLVPKSFSLKKYPFQERIKVKYEYIEKYTLGFGDVSFKETNFSLDVIVGRPYIFIVDKNGKEYKINVKQYSRRQIDEILDELYKRTGIRSLKYTKDWKKTNVFKRKKENQDNWKE